MALFLADSAAASPGSTSIVLPAGIQNGDVGFVCAASYNTDPIISAAPGGTAGWTLVRNNSVQATYANYQRVYMQSNMQSTSSGGTISFTGINASYSGIIFVLIRGADLAEPSHHTFGETKTNFDIWTTTMTSVHTRPARRLFFGSQMANTSATAIFTPTGPITVINTIASTNPYYRVSAYIHDETQGSGTHADTSLKSSVTGAGVAGVISIGDFISRTHQMMM